MYWRCTEHRGLMVFFLVLLQLTAFCFFLLILEAVWVFFFGWLISLREFNYDKYLNR